MAIAIEIEGYDSLEQVAVGGMAAVYKARRISIDKVVAIKVLFPYLANDESFIERFQREAKSAAKVQHENIVNVVDFGESGGCYYIVMEYYEGMTVADLLKEHPRIPLDVAVSILLDVCFGLEAAHAKDIVHRDIKPANVIYTHQGGIKIADFGLAKKSDTMTVVTQPGKVLGTPAYMSPEQAAGDAVGPQSDIFSLGVVAYELFCQKRPFEGGSYSEVLERIQTHRPPSLTHENPLIQPDFEDVVARMLEKDLTRRYASISEVIGDLEKAMERFEIRRDRRRLRRYMADPQGYTERFTEKMVSKCLAQGTYYMQKGETHITDAVQEFKRILFLDPSNERARKHLQKLLAQYPDENSTVTLEKTVVKEARTKRKKRPEKSVAQRRPKPRRSGKGRRAVWVSFVVIAVLATAGWWAWNNVELPGGNAAPMVSSPARMTVGEGEHVEFSLNVVDTDGDSVRIYSDELPAGAAISPQGRFRWEVDHRQAGTYTMQFYASDGRKVGKSTTVIEVVDKVATLDFADVPAATTEVGKTVRARLQASSSYGEAIQFTLQNQPGGMSLQGDRVSWTPSKEQTGTHRIPIYGTDGIAEASKTWVVRVKPKADARPKPPATGRVDWALPQPANIYVDGKLKVRGTADLSIRLSEGRHTVRAEFADGITAFEREVTVRGGSRTTLDPPVIRYGRLSAYFLGGVGELRLNGKKFTEQPPFTGVTVPVGKYTITCDMFRDEDSRQFEIEIREGYDTIIEYEIGSEPNVSHERADG